MHIRSQHLFFTLSLLLVMLLFACSPTKKTTLHRGVEKSTHSPSNINLEKETQKWLGVPYKLGGNDFSGIDCSGLVLAIYKEVYKIKLPRTTKDQALIGTPVDTTQLLKGDLVFFNTSGKGVSHVGIYLGQNSFLHASTSKGVIKSSMHQAYYKSRFLFARRVYFQ